MEDLVNIFAEAADVGSRLCCRAKEIRGGLAKIIVCDTEKTIRKKSFQTHAPLCGGMGHPAELG